MTFQNDVFISYAHLDNQPLTPGTQGWVSDFHEALCKRLGEVWGRAPRVWRDPKLQGNDIFAAELEGRYEGAAVLVSVITPRYVESDWCQRELTGFWEAAEHSGGAVLGTKARVFKVVKTPVERERIPAPVQPLLGYEFYRLQPGSGRPLEFNKVYGSDAERDFWVRLNDLAYDVADLLKLLEPSGAPPAAARPTAYLAAATSAEQPQHDALRRELLRRGYGVLPESELPLVAAELEEHVAQALKQCQISIHLVGTAYGVVPEGSEESVAALQARLAAERARSGGFVRLVWIAPGAGSMEPRQRAFLDALRNDPAPGQDSDLLETPFEELKNVVLARLEAAERPKAGGAVSGAAAGRAKRVYVVCDARDSENVRPLQKHLFDLGFEVLPPVFEGDEAGLRKYHETQLSECDGLIIYYGAGSELWLNEKLSELRRLAAGRKAPLRSAAICIVPPITPAKQNVLTHDALTITMPGGFTPDALRAFTTALQDPETPP